jgi:hypothetical protein
MTADDVRARAIEDGERALSLSDSAAVAARPLAAAVVDAVEPIIRADERAEALEFCCADTRPQIEAEVRERITAAVESMWDEQCCGHRNTAVCESCRAFDDVLRYAVDGTQ